jgi:hypothetical protein
LPADTAVSTMSDARAATLEKARGIAAAAAIIERRRVFITGLLK